MSTDVDGGKAKNDIERKEHNGYLLRQLAHEQQDNRGHSDVRTWEGGNGIFALLSLRHQFAEESRRMRVVELRVEAEPIANCGKVSGLYGFHSDFGEIELRSCRLQEQIDNVIEDERTEQYRRGALKAAETIRASHDDHCNNHQVIGEITHIEQFAPKGAAEPLTEGDGRLATENHLVGHCKNGVGVLGQFGEVVDIGIPISQ